MKKTLYFIGIICLLFSGCYKDLGNYDYHEINEVEITGLPAEKQIKFRLADSLIVKPDIKGNLDGNNPGRYKYEWKATTKKSSTTTQASVVIGNEVNLNYFVEIPDEDYDVHFYVKDTITGVTWGSSFELKVTSVLKEGWLILSDENGVSRMDMISLSGKDEVFMRNLLKNSGMPAQQGPRKLCYVYNMMTSSGNGRMYLVSNSGAVKLNMEDYKWDEANSLEYEMAEYPKNFAPDMITAGFGWEMIISKDKVYTEVNPAGGPVLFSLPMNYTEVQKTDEAGKVTVEKKYFEAAPAVGSLTGYSAYNPAKFLYDISNKRFLMTDAKKCYYPTVKETKFKFQTGKEFVYMTPSLKNFSSGNVYTILEDLPGHKRYLYNMTLSGSSATQVDSIELNIPNIDKATAFAVHPSLQYLFYAVGNEVYEYNISENIPINKPVLTFEGETVTVLKFNIFRSLYANAAKFQNKLIVGTAKSGAGLNGVVRFYDVPVSFGDPFNKEVPFYDGIGTPVDVSFREP